MPFVCLCYAPDRHLTWMATGSGGYPSPQTATAWGFRNANTEFVNPLRSLLDFIHMTLEGLKPGSRAKFPKLSSLQQLEVPLFRLLASWGFRRHWGDGSTYGTGMLLANLLSWWSMVMATALGTPLNRGFEVQWSVSCTKLPDFISYICLLIVYLLHYIISLRKSEILLFTTVSYSAQHKIGPQ